MVAWASALGVQPAAYPAVGAALANEVTLCCKSKYAIFTMLPLLVTRLDTMMSPVDVHCYLAGVRES